MSANFGPSSHLSFVNAMIQRVKARAQASNTIISEDNQNSLLQWQAENKLLNTQARVEYELLRRWIYELVEDSNRYLYDDDYQFSIKEYQLCTSVRFRTRFFVMEFKQILINNYDCNHSLDLVFQASGRSTSMPSRTTLILKSHKGNFVWRQLNPVAAGLAGTSRKLSHLITSWLKYGINMNEEDGPA